eukprot:CAMPEP_0184361826 /NCGR_PEP_ID=MMETSP1089-20130417/132072_1 /TAXON_ID=38269 ORGANISM="Gloeochaete wittrockiana, Strain SAG46.84" /NCGR_SAMPLE_ID=MMETSP1089 /ASSEMBLY_ACC=CAM_ASM_000445 /LENGTH=97 /DNA_ID=CAMNT_0026701643 /DNA_START=34 /DNA_END=323 /DNA_ORIENTATION=+
MSSCSRRIFVFLLDVFIVAAVLHTVAYASGERPDLRDVTILPAHRALHGPLRVAVVVNDVFCSEFHRKRTSSLGNLARVLAVSGHRVSFIFITGVDG